METCSSIEDRKLADFEAEGEFEVKRFVAGPNSNFDGGRVPCFFKQYAEILVDNRQILKESIRCTFRLPDSVKTLLIVKHHLKPSQQKLLVVGDIAKPAHMPKN